MVGSDCRHVVAPRGCPPGRNYACTSGGSHLCRWGALDLGAGRAFLACLLESSQGEEGDCGLTLNVAVLWFFLGLQFKKQKMQLCFGHWKEKGGLTLLSLERTCNSGQICHPSMVGHMSWKTDISNIKNIWLSI